MDPVTAIGLASGILSFITFSGKLIAGAIKIHDTTDGHVAENRSRELVIQEMKKMSERLLAPDDSSFVGQDKGLCLLAAECSTLSNDPLALLERIKPKDCKSKAESLWLDRCRSQLELQVTFLTSRETRASLDSLLSMAETDNHTLLRLQANIEQLSQGIQVSSLSETAQRQLRELVGVQESVLQAIARQRILEAISFEGMDARYNMVDDAYVKTFQWIFGDTYPLKMDDEDVEGLDLREADEEIAAGEYKQGIRPGHDDVETDEKALEMKRLAREKLMGWLSCQDGIFHISGKLGSGKSTLMRFLFEHHGTRSELEKWAGHRAVVLAGFFFWSPGSDLQKSLAGLFRSILHSILQQCPELVPQVLPDLWAKARAVPVQVQLGIAISEKEIETAFNRLVRNKSLYERHCFCIFIDGLDEFHATPHVDRKELVDLLHGWTRASSGVKLCVSSREDNVFMNAFSPKRRFRLHELTKHDMRSYVNDKLKHFPDGESKTWLIATIPERAQEIFLWVSVVSKSMREEFENGKSVESLWSMLEALPDELHDLFVHILRSLSRTVKKRAHQTLKMLLLSKEIGIGFFVLGYSFYEDYESDQNFAMTKSFKSQAARLRGDSDFIAKRIDMGEKQLTGWCRGLLETIPERPGEPATIDYTHRSVAEFLEEKNIRAEIAEYTEGFDSTHAISQLVLATHSYLVDPNIRGCPSEAVAARDNRVYSEIMQHRQTMGLDLKPPFEFLESLASLRACTFAGKFDPECWVDLLLYIPGEGLPDEHISLTLMVNIKKRAAERRRFDHPLTIAARLRNYDYIAWKLRRDPVLVRDPNFMALLTYALVWTETVMRHPWSASEEPPPDWEFIGSLLEQGFIRPNTPTLLQPYVWPPYFLGSIWWKIRSSAKATGDVNQHGNEAFNVSIWEHLLMMFFLGWLAPTRLEPSYLGAMLQVFLEHGAENSALCAHVDIIGGDEEFVKRLTVRFEVETEDETKSDCVSYSNESPFEELYRAELRDRPIGAIGFRDVSGWDFEEIEGRKTFNKTFTLRSWVEYCTDEELPNKDRILYILDQTTTRTAVESSLDVKDDDARGLSSSCNDCPKDARRTVDGADDRQTMAQENNSLSSSENLKPGGPLFLTASQVRGAHTPSSVFGTYSVHFLVYLVLAGYSIAERLFHY
ncbi:hypothetical protein V8F20_012664 [Naviculisporaceae sp. PSN 640]